MNEPQFVHDAKLLNLNKIGQVYFQSTYELNSDFVDSCF